MCFCLHVDQYLSHDDRPLKKPEDSGWIKPDDKFKQVQQENERKKAERKESIIIYKLIARCSMYVALEENVSNEKKYKRMQLVFFIYIKINWTHIYWLKYKNMKT